MTQPSCLCLCVVGRNTPWLCSCGRAGTTTACPTITPTRRWGWTVDLWTSCGCPTLSSSTPNLLGSTMSPWRTSWSACSPMESFYTAAGMSKKITAITWQTYTVRDSLSKQFVSGCFNIDLLLLWLISSYFQFCCFFPMPLKNFRHWRALVIHCIWEWKSLINHTIIWLLQREKGGRGTWKDKVDQS